MIDQAVLIIIFYYLYNYNIIFSHKINIKNYLYGVYVGYTISP